METPKDPALETAVPPQVHIHHGALTPPAIHSTLAEFPTTVRHLLAQGASETEGSLRPVAACHRLKLYDAKITRVQQLPLWRRKPPRVAAPRMPSKRVRVRTGVIPQIRARLRRGRFRPMQVRLHQIAPVSTPGTGTQTDYARTKPWALLVHALEVFSAQRQTYYRWYSRDRLGLDLDDDSFVGICCHLPPLQLSATALLPSGNAAFRLLADAHGDINPALEGRHGLVFSRPETVTVVRLPPPQS